MTPAHPGTYRDEFMQRALALSAQALDTPGTEPFGAVVVKDGRIVGEGFNHSVAHWDPTSHGETEAIRDACRRLTAGQGENGIGHLIDPAPVPIMR